jgi:peptidoglycan/LPS O-acetylase OafA/YrhL
LKYRPEIDGLRALAVLPVILFHAGIATFSGGFVGVDVFFVISGYLISSIIMVEIEEHKFSVVSFYERRARRILPALFFVMLWCLPVAIILMLPVQLKEFSESIISVSLFVSNIFFWSSSGYFETEAELKPLLHTWSLSVEEQFYIFFPFVLVWLWHFGRNRIVVVIVVAALCSLLLSEWAVRNAPSANFYLFPTRAWELLVGVYAAFYISSKGLNPSNPLSTFGIVLIAVAIFTFDDKTPFPGLYAVIPVLGTFLIIVFGLKGTMVAQLLSKKLFVYIGLLSYSAYLWHQPIFSFASLYTFQQLNFITVVALIVLSFSLAFVSWMYIEKPFRDNRRFSRRFIFSFSLIGILFFSGIGFYGYKHDGFILITDPKSKIISEAVNDWSYPGQLVVRSTSGLYSYTEGSIDILFYGDSHAEQFAPLAELIYKHRGLNAGFLTGGGCPPIPNIYEEKHKNCDTLFDRFDEVLNDNTSIKSVVIAGCFNCYFLKSLNPHSRSSNYNYYVRSESGDLSLDTPKGQSKALLHLKEFGDRIGLEKKIFLVGDNPSGVSFDPNIILINKIRGDSVAFNKQYPDFNSSLFDVPIEMMNLNKKLRELFRPNSMYIDMLALICEGAVCKTTSKNGIPMYKDDNHLNASYVGNELSRALLPYVFSHIDE